MIDHNELDAIIQARRSVYPNMYSSEPLADHTIWELLENANWAPTHRKTEPWRFTVLKDNALRRLGEYLAADYVNETPQEFYSEIKHQKMLNKAVKCGAAIIITMQRDPEQRLPEWEEIAAVSCAVQNLWLSCTARGIGCYWSSPSSLVRRNTFIELNEGERCLGIIYMGQWEQMELPAERGDIKEKVRWLSE